MTLSELVTTYRTEHELSQRQFALKCGVSNGYIAMLEKNLNPKTGLPLVPTIPYLIKIAKGLNITLTELFDLVDDMPVSLQNDEKSAIDDDDGLSAEIIQLFSRLSDDKRIEAVNYLRYLATQEEN